MLKEFQTFIKENKLFDSQHRILLAVSGGMDSVVMASLFAKSGYKFGIAHCNFQLRGEESEADEAFVRNLAKTLKAPFFVNKFDTEAFAQTEKLSIQMAARTLRYAWFENLMAQENFDYLATAHHQNDVFETVLLNLTRGTGIAGLHGVPLRNGRVIRPLWFADRDQIMDHMASSHLAWREDSSNASTKYHRNLIRQEVVPVLKDINPNLEATSKQSIERVMAIEKVFEQYLEELRGQVISTQDGAIFVSIAPLIQLPNAKVILAELLKPFGFDFVQSSEIHKSMDAQAGKQFLSATHLLVKDREALVITPKVLPIFGLLNLSEETKEISWETTKLKTEKYDYLPDKAIDTNPKMALLDAGTLRFPLQIRTWHEGDWLIPLGMKGKKKVSDYLIDKKVPLNLKNQVKVLLSDDKVVWIIGHRIDDRFKITEKTKVVFKLSLS
jgi:tRNA(Ile)-lysidine synthase